MRPTDDLEASGNQLSPQNTLLKKIINRDKCSILPASDVLYYFPVKRWGRGKANLLASDFYLMFTLLLRSYRLLKVKVSILDIDRNERHPHVQNRRPSVRPTIWFLTDLLKATNCTLCIPEVYYRSFSSFIVLPFMYDV